MAEKKLYATATTTAAAQVAPAATDASTAAPAVAQAVTLAAAQAAAAYKQMCVKTREYGNQISSLVCIRHNTGRDGRS